MAGNPRRRRLLAAAGDVYDPTLWSGIPYHFLQAAVCEGTLDAGLALRPPAGPTHRARRATWNAMRALSGAGIRGYQYSESRLNLLWRDQRRALSGAVVVNMFQLYPPWLIEAEDIQKWFSVDQTLYQNFSHYGLDRLLGQRTMREAMALEQAGYRSAAGVVTHSHWAREDVVTRYGIPAHRVHVVKEAANVDAADYLAWEQNRGSADPADTRSRPVRLVFVGRYGIRKGLDRLLGALAIARDRGSRIELRVIGCEPAAVPAKLRTISGVEWVGFISKQPNSRQFITAVSECDIGCLLSRAEAAGSSVFEFHALGLAVLGTNAGGSAEQPIPEASVVVDVEATDEEVASILMALEANPARLRAMRNAAWERRHTVMWPSRAREIGQLLDATDH